MSLEEKVKQEKLETLTDMWASLKKSESEYNQKRLDIENEIIEVVKDKLKTKGTSTFLERLQIAVSEDNKWNQAEVSKLKNMFDEGELNDIPFFPFDIEYKPNNAKIKLLKEQDEKLFFKVFGDALTVKPKKPSFTLKG